MWPTELQVRLKTVVFVRLTCTQLNCIARKGETDLGKTQRLKQTHGVILIIVTVCY